MVWFPSGLPASPSAVRNILAASHRSRHWSWVEPGVAQVAPLAEQATPAPAHAHPPGGKPLLRLGQPGAQHLQALLLAVPLRLGGVAAGAPPPSCGRGSQPRLDRADPRPQARRLGLQVPLRQVPLVLAGPGDRARPPR